MQGTAAVLRRIDALKDALNKDIPDSMMKHLGDAAKRANNDYSSFAVSNYVGPIDVSVHAERDGNEYRIVASGSTLLFLEFGTGIHYPRPSEMLPEAAAYPAKSWSAGHKQYLTNPKKFQKWNGWWPTPPAGMITDGNPAANIFYELGKEIEWSTTPVVKTELKKALQ